MPYWNIFGSGGLEGTLKILPKGAFFDENGPLEIAIRIRIKLIELTRKEIKLGRFSGNSFRHNC